MMRINSSPTVPRRTLRCAALGAALLLGCGRASEPAPEKVGESRAPVAAPEERGTTLSTPTWPAAATIDAAAVAALPAKAAQAIAGSPVPVLIPRRAELLAAGAMVVDQHWYSFNARSGGITVTLAGTRLARRYSSIPPARGTATIRGAAAFVTQNEAIWSATWSENGVTYTLDLECADPGEARCASDEELRAIAGDLAYAGGAGVRR